MLPRVAFPVITRLSAAYGCMAACLGLTVNRGLGVGTYTVALNAVHASSHLILCKAVIEQETEAYDK